jgi:hypothetical protein
LEAVSVIELDRVLDPTVPLCDMVSVVE